MKIRRAQETDLSRIAEIFIFNNRIFYFPIFKDESYSFGELQVVPLAERKLRRPDVMRQLFVADSGIIKGFMQVDGTELCKLYVDPFFQSEGTGGRLLDYAVTEFHADHLWALEKNTRAVSFYERHGFVLTGEKKYEDGTTEFLVKLTRSEKDEGKIEKSH